MSRRFRKGELTKESFKIIMFDLYGLETRNQDDFNYHFELLKGNLQDIFGMDEVEDDY